MSNNPYRYLITIYLSLLFITIMFNVIIIAAFNLQSVIWLVVLCVFVPISLLILFGLIQYQKYNLFVKHISTSLNLKNILYELLEESSYLEKREDLCHLILQKAISALPNAYKGSILKVVDESFTFEAAIGFDMALLKTISLKKHETYLYKETNGKLDRTVIIHNSAEYNKNSPAEENQKLLNMYGMKDIQTTISTPINVKGKLWGMLNADSNIKDAFNDEDIRSFEIFAFEIEKIIKLFDSLEANQYLLNHDPLTKISNRHYFNESLSKYMETISQSTVFSLASIDLNDLKRINDTYGHHQGDQLILRFVECINRYLRTQDIFARYGGDEFIIIFKNMPYNEADVIIKAAESALESEGLVIDGHIELISFSYGIVEYPRDGVDIDLLLKTADKKMYEDKRLKRVYYYGNQLENWNEKLD